MKKINTTSTVFLCIFLLASLLRIYPAWLNRDANDDHFRVIRIIAFEHRIPDKEEFDCLQCYHPKLYHFSAAQLVRFFHAEPGIELKIVSQMLSATAGIITLIFGYLFLKKLPLRESTRFFSYLLFALHPALLTINIQATNDSFVILFSSLALFFLYSYLKERTWVYFLLMLISVIFASLSKGSGLIILLGIALILLIDISIANKESKVFLRSLLSIGTFILVAAGTIIAFGPYDEYFATYGSPLVINKEKSPLPHFFKKTYVGEKTGIVSIFDGYFTFHPFDLIRAPFLDRESLQGEYSSSRTSLFTQLYARTTFIQYEGRPKEWFTKPANSIYRVGKMIYLVSLIPLFLFLFGLYIDTRKRIIQLLSGKASTVITDPTWIFTFFFWGFFLFIIKFTLEYREYSAMKPIYLYPALFAFLYLFSLGFEKTQDILKNKYLRYGLFVSLCGLSLLFILDVLALIQKLS